MKTRKMLTVRVAPLFMVTCLCVTGSSLIGLEAAKGQEVAQGFVQCSNSALVLQKTPGCPTSPVDGKCSGSYSKYIIPRKICVGPAAQSPCNPTTGRATVTEFAGYCITDKKTGLCVHGPDAPGFPKQYPNQEVESCNNDPITTSV